MAAFVASVVAQSTASVAEFNASKLLSQLNLQALVLNNLITASCAAS